MTKNDLKRLFERNPKLANANPDICQIFASKPQRRAPDALDPVAERKNESLYRPRISFTFLRTRLLDADGYRGGEKDLLDGLKKAGLISDDKVSDIDLLPAQQVKVSKKSEEGTIIEIEFRAS